MFFLVGFILLIFRSSCSCDSQINQSLQDIDYFTQNGFKLRLFDRMGYWLGQLSLFDMKAVYQQCLNKTIIDPTVAFPRSETQCLTALYQVYQLNGNYSSNPTKFKQDVEKIGKTIFSSYSSCHTVLNVSTPFPNPDCIQHIKDSRDILEGFLNDIDKGGNGTKYMSQLLTIALQQRTICGVKTIFQNPMAIKNDDCNEASRQCLYHLVDSLDLRILKKDYKYYAQYLYIFYQLAYRAQIVCNKSNLETMNLQMKNRLREQDNIEQLQFIIDKMKMQNLQRQKEY